MLRYYIEDKGKIIAYDENLEHLKNVLKHMPDYANYEIKHGDIVVAEDNPPSVEDDSGIDVMNPDYTRCIAKTWNVVHIAEDHGYIHVNGRARDNGPMILTIDGHEVFVHGDYGGVSRAVNIVPISKGQEYVVRGGTGFELTFIYSKGVK